MLRVSFCVFRVSFVCLGVSRIISIFSPLDSLLSIFSPLDSLLTSKIGLITILGKIDKRVL